MTEKESSSGQVSSNGRERGTPRTLLKLSIVLPLFLSIATAIATGLTYSLFQQALTGYYEFDGNDNDFMIKIAIVLTITFCGAVASLMGILYGSMSIFTLSCGISFAVSLLILFTLKNIILAGGKDTGFLFDMVKSVMGIAFPSIFSACILPILRQSQFLMKLNMSKDDFISRSVFLMCQFAAQAMAAQITASRDNDLLIDKFNILIWALALACTFFKVNETIIYLIYTGAAISILPCTMNFKLYGGEPFVLFIAFLIVMIVLMAAFNNRQHPNGLLFSADALSATEIVASRASLIAFLHTLQNVRDDSNGVLALFGVSIGAFSMLGLAVVFGAVGDSWEAIGSNQWQMTSVDTLSLLFHFIFPIVLLLYRACDKYDAISFLQLALNKEESDLDSVLIGLSTLLVFILVLALSTINSLSPIGAYLCSRAYLNGQPSTKKVALVVALSDLVEELNEEEMKSFLNFMKENKATLNVFVKFSDLKLRPDVVRLMAENGHHLGISSYSHCFENGEVSHHKIHSVRYEMEQVLRKNPVWYLPTKGHRHPFALKACTETNMRVCFWSTLCHTGISTSEECLSNIKRDVNDKVGGNIVYVTKGEGNCKSWSSINSLLKEAVRQLSDMNFKVENLCQVVKDDHILELKHREKIHNE